MPLDSRMRPGSGQGTQGRKVRRPQRVAVFDANEDPAVLIEIWSDIVCPWCAIGKHRLDTALATHPRADDIDVTWRSFQLDPNATSDGQPTIPRLAAKYRVSILEAEAMVARVEQTAAADGLHLDLRNSVAANTHDAHRLLHLATEHDLQSEAQEVFMAAALADHQDVGDHDTLRDLATAAGLPTAEVVEVLATDRFADQVRADQQQAYELGCSGVPFFVLDRRFAIAGAQSVEVFHQALDRALATPA
jgi:predicted DsbA family dithiol-disulfide isomerase